MGKLYIRYFISYFKFFCKGIPPEEKIVCFFQFLMSGLELHANSMMGRYISLLTKAFVSIKGEELGQMQTSRSYSGIEHTKGQRVLRKKGFSASALTSIERNLARQSRMVNKLRYYSIWLSTNRIT